MMAMQRALATLSRVFGPSPSLSPATSRLPGVLPQLLRPYPRLPRTLQPTQAAAAVRRYAHAIPKPPPKGGQDKTRKQLEPHYELTFTCVPCSERSTHTISKQGYHHGSVLITCPGCRNRHIISDHLNIFGDRKITIEDLMRERGQLVKRGTLGEDGDIEFWEDGTQTERANHNNANNTPALEDADNVPSAQDTQPTPPSSSTATASGPLTGGTPRPKLHTSSPKDSAPSSRREYHSDATDGSSGVKEPPKFQIRKQMNELRTALRNMGEPLTMTMTKRKQLQSPLSNPPTRPIFSERFGKKEEGQRVLPMSINSSQPLRPRSSFPRLAQYDRSAVESPHRPFKVKKGMPGNGPFKPMELNNGAQSLGKENPARAKRSYKKANKDVTQF